MIGAQHYVYRNLHRQCWGIRLRGKVVDHAHEVWIRHAEFKVFETGRQRVIREKRKNVHAFVVGAFSLDPCVAEILDMGNPVRVSYNPYTTGSFTVGDYPWAVKRAKLVCLRADGVVLAWGVK